MRKKKYTVYILSLTLIAAIASCSTAQYGYDDAYDHDYPAVYANNTINTQPTQNNNSVRNDYSENYTNTYEEEDYTRYDNSDGNSRYNGSYSNRINRFHNNSVFGPSVSFGYFSNIYVPNRGFNNFNNFNGFNNNMFGFSPFASNNLLFYDPYQWHVNNFHNPFWGRPFNNGFGFGGSPFLGNNINIFYGNGFGNNFCPTTYNPYYGNPLFFNEGVNNNSNPIYYGPRGNYNQYNGGNNQANENGVINGNGNLQNQSGTFNRNGVQVKTIAKPNAAPNNNGTIATPKTNTVPANVSQPKQNAPRSNSTPKPRYNSTPKTNPVPKANPTPRPRYSAPKATPKPRFNSTPKSNPAPRPRYSAPKSNPTPRPSYSTPRSNSVPRSTPSNGVQIRRTPK